MGLFPLKPSFAGGELTPALYGRTELQKYDIGAAKLQNAYVLRYGGASRRPGFRYVAPTHGKQKARLIPFSYSTEQNYVLEFTAGAIRIYTNGGIVTDEKGRPVVVSSPYKEADLATMKYVQSADVLFLAQPNHPPMTLTRYSQTDWRLVKMEITGGPFGDPNVDDSLRITPSDVVGEVTLTATGDCFNADMVGQNIRLGHTLSGEQKVGIPGTQTTSEQTPTQYVAKNAHISGKLSGTIDGQATGVDPEAIEEPRYVRDSFSNGDINGTFSGTYNAITRMIEGTLESADVHYYNDFYGTVSGVFSGTIDGIPTTPATIETSPLQVDCVPHGTVYVETFGFWTGTVIVQRYEPGTGGWVTLQSQNGNHTQNYTMKFTNENDQILTYRVVAKDYNNGVWSGENGNQAGYVTIQTFSQDYYGVARVIVYEDPKKAKAIITKKLGSKEGTNDFSLYPWNDVKGYPGCVGFFEDRLVFAGSKAKPQTYWASKSGDYYNFSVSAPQQDDDAITGTISSGQMNTIKALVTFSEMLMLTSGGEFKVGGGSEAFTPTNQKAKPQEYRGINDLTPVLVGGRVVYVQHQGSIVRDLTYSYDVDKYTGDDVSLLAAHLFDGHKLTSITYQQTPNSIVWCTRDDGVLLGMTYIKEQDVYAWHQHTTQGEFVDVCSIPGRNEDELWAVVKRGSTYYVEQMATQNRDVSPANQFFVDAGFAYEGEATEKLSGLSWLSGETVQILADGNSLPTRQVAADGSVTLDGKYNKVIVGLPYETVIRTMPVEFSGNDGSFGSRKKRIARMAVQFRDTRGGLFGVNEKALDEIKWRSTEKYGESIALYEGKRKVVIPQATYSDTLFITIKQADPLPMTILSIIPEVEPGG